MSGYEPLTGLQWVTDAFASAAGTVRRSFDFEGRSRRTEVLGYWLVSSLAVGIASSLVDWLGDWREARWTELFLGALQVVPVFALFARRLHDMGFTGWLAVPLIPAAGMGLYKDYWSRLTPPDIMIQGYPYDLLTILLTLPGALLSFWVLIHDGQYEENRYGPDPRMEPAEAVAARP